MSRKIRALLPHAAVDVVENEAQLSTDHYQFLQDIETTANSFEDLFLRPAQFGAKGGGVIDEEPAFGDMFALLSTNSGGYIIFAPNKTYNLDFSALVSGFFWYDAGSYNGLRIEGSGSAITFTRAFADGELGYFFVGNTIGDVVIENLHMTMETGIDSTGFLPKGLQTFYFATASGNIVYRNIVQAGGRAGLWTHYNNLPGPPRNKRVLVDNYITQNTFYPLSIQNTDYACVRNFNTTNAGRSLFLENSQNVDVTMASANPILDDVILAAANWPDIFSGTELSNISIKYQRRDGAAGSNSMALILRTSSSSGFGPATIKNIDLLVDIDGGKDAMYLQRQIEGSGTLDTGAARGHLVDGIWLHGTARNLTNNTGIHFSDATFGGELKVGDAVRNVTIGPFYGDTLDATTFHFKIDGAAFITPLVVRDTKVFGNIALSNFAAGMVKLYNCQFLDYATNATITPLRGDFVIGLLDIGNGSITGRYFREGSQVTWSCLMVFGTTTVLGTGLWKFGLPGAYDTNSLPISHATGSARGLSAGVPVHGTCFVNAGVGNVFIEDDTNSWGSAYPGAWVSGDYLQFQITFEV